MFRRLFASAAVIVTAATLIVAAPARSTPVFAASGSIAVTPATQPVAPGGSVTVTLTQSSAAGTTGAEATITFDPTIVQLQDVQPGPAYASATLLFGSVPGGATRQHAGQPPTVAEEALRRRIRRASSPTRRRSWRPGTGTVPAGDNAFLVLTMQAVAASGTSPISLSKLEMLDDQYSDLTVTSTDGAVVVGGAGAPPPAPSAPAAAPTTQVASTPAPATPAQASPAANATAKPAPSATASSGVAGISAAPSLKSAAFAVSPATQKVAKEATFTFAVTQLVDGAASNAQADVSFKKDLVEIVKLEPGAGWKADSKALDTAMSDANTSGELKVTLTADKTKGPATSGESTILTVTMQGRTGKEGKSAIKLVSTDITGSDGSSPQITSKDGEVIVGNAGGGSNMLLIVVGVLAGVVIVGGGGGDVRGEAREGAPDAASVA